jgi:hypothetical protein
MAKTGGHIKRANVGTVEMHNERKQEYLDALEAAGHPLHYFPELTNGNQHWVNSDRHYHGKTCAQIFELQKRWYTMKKHQPPQLKDRTYIDKNGREKIRAGWSPIREAVIVIKPDTKIEDFDPVLEWFRKKGCTPIRLDLHWDEGHIDKKTGKRHINNHAHLSIDWMDWKTGSTVKLGKKDMSELQTVLANALGMERGELKEVTGKDNIDQATYRAMAQAKENREIAEENEQLKAQRDDLTSAVEDKQRQVDDLDAQAASIGEDIDVKTSHQLSLQSAIAMLQHEVTALEDSKRKADRKARASIWQKVASVFGADKLINDLRRKNRQLEEQIKAVEAKRKADAAKYKAEVEKARQGSQKPLLDLLKRIGTKLGITPSSSRNNYTESAVILKLDEHIEHERLWYDRMCKAEKALKAEREKGQEQSPSTGLKL